MTPERWSKLEDLYHAACAMEAKARPSFLDATCGSDTELRSEVESLLLREVRAEGFLEPEPSAEEITGDIGPYRIVGRIGAGGMGEVYRANDLKLGRDVALKLLRRDFGADPERLERLRREAHLLASLNHPNVASIYGLEEARGFTCLVLELVEGQSLQGPLPVKTALEYASQLAEALEAAHAAGMVHRDLKPANVKITPQGRVKVLDFGLAKPLGATNRETPSTGPRSAVDSVPGLIAGTPSYMSPEQAAGGAIDKRADIWSFGCLLYELLAGKKAFPGESAEDIIEAVKLREPDWAALPAGTPAAVLDLIRRCLRKDVSRRIQQIAEARVVLEQVKRRKPEPLWKVDAAMVLAILAAACTVAFFGPPAPPRVKIAQAKPLTSYQGAELFPALSPDAQSVAFTWAGSAGGRTDLYRKPVNVESRVRLTDDAALECYPAWSPNGRLIAFLHCQGDMGMIRSEAEIFVVDSGGGAKRKIGKLLLHAYENAGALAWMPSSKQLVVRGRRYSGERISLHSLNIESGEMRQLTSPPPGFDDAFPALSQDGRYLAFIRQTEGTHGNVFIADLATRAPAKQIANVQLQTYGLAWRSPDELIYLTGDGAARSLWRVGADGSNPELLPGTGQIGVQFSLSGDGRTLAFTDAFIDTDITRVNLAKARPREPAGAERFIASTQFDGSPDYSPGMRNVVFASARSGKYELWLADADGSDQVQLTHWNRMTGSPQWSPDGEEIAADSHDGEYADIFVVGAKNRSEKKITSGRNVNVVPRWSRDSRWVYFSSNRTGRFEIWKAPARAALESGPEPVQVTKRGGFAGAESFDGRHYYYASIDTPRCVKMVPSAGGEETIVTCPLDDWIYLAMFQDGFYYVPQTSTQIWFYNFARRQGRPAFDLRAGAGGTFTFSPDRRWMLVTTAELRGDLYLLDLGS